MGGSHLYSAQGARHHKLDREVDGGAQCRVVGVLQREGAGVLRVSDDFKRIRLLFTLWEETHKGVIKRNRHGEPLVHAEASKVEGKNAFITRKEPASIWDPIRAR